MIGLPSVPAPCCDHCVAAHRGDWEVRPNPHAVQESDGPPCVFCGSARPGLILTVACPLGARSPPN